MLKLKEQTSFKIEGCKGEYELPSFFTLSLEDVEPVLDLSELSAKDRAKACKKFLLGICPELAAEGLGDMAYLKIYLEYDRSQVLGSIESLGES